MADNLNDRNLQTHLRESRGSSTSDPPGDPGLASSTGTGTQNSVLDVPFDGTVGWAQHIIMTVQNVFALVGMFLFPAILGAVAGLNPGQVAELYGVTFFVVGVGTVLQGVMGLKMPIVIGPWAGALAGLLATAKPFGLATAFGSLFVAGLIWAVLSLPIPHLSPIGLVARFFREPILYGGIVMLAMAGLTNITVVNWIGTPAQPGFGVANWIGGLVAILVIGALIVLTRGFLRSVAMLIAIILGTAAYAIFQPLHFSQVSSAPWFTAPTVFPFGLHVNGFVVVLFFLLLTPAVASSLSHYNLLADWAAMRLEGQRMAWGIFGLSLAGVLAGILGTFSLSVYPDNLAIVRSSRIGSRWITVSAGALLIVAGFFTKFDALFVIFPGNVIGASAVVLFGILFMSGIAALSDVQWDQLNLLVIGLPFMLSMGGMFVAPTTMATYPLIVREIIAQPLFTGPLLMLVLHVAVNKIARPRLGMNRMHGVASQTAPQRDQAPAGGTA